MAKISGMGREVGRGAWQEIRLEEKAGFEV